MRIISFFLTIIFISCQSVDKSECNYITDYYQTIYKADFGI